LSLQYAYAEVHTWTSHDGQFSIQASFVRLGSSGGKPAVVLRKEDGASLTVPLDKLDQPTQELAARLARPKDATETGGIGDSHWWRDAKGKTLVRQGKLIGWDITNKIIVLETPRSEWKLLFEPDLSKRNQQLLTQLKAEGQSLGLIAAEELLQINAVFKENLDKQNAEISDRIANKINAALQRRSEDAYDAKVGFETLAVVMHAYRHGPFGEIHPTKQELIEQLLAGDLGDQRFVIGDRIEDCRTIWKVLPAQRDVRSWCNYRRIIFPKRPPWPSGGMPSPERLTAIRNALLQHTTGQNGAAENEIVASLQLSSEEARALGSVLGSSLLVDSRFSSNKEVFMRDRTRLALAAIAEHIETRVESDPAEQRAQQIEAVASKLMK